MCGSPTLIHDYGSLIYSTELLGTTETLRYLLKAPLKYTETDGLCKVNHGHEFN